MTIKQLRDRRAEIVRDGEAVIAAYTSEKRDPTDEEVAQLEALASARQAVEGQIEALETRMELERGFQVDSDAQVSGGRPRAEDDPKRGWKSLGEFTVACRQAARRPAAMDERLRLGAAPTTYAGEDTGADGGFLVPPGFSASVVSDSREGQALMPLVTEIPITGNSMAFPADEDEEWSTSGIQMYWEGENDQLAQSKPVLKLKEMRLRKLAGLFPVTDELASDANAIEAHIEAKAGKTIRHKHNDALVNGSGAGVPLGVVGHGGTVSVAKESSQTAATIVIENLLKMYSRAINPMRCIWIANIDTFPQLFDLKDNSDARVYQTSVAGLPDNMSAMLLGRPLMFIEECQTLGTVGDIIFGDWAEYLAITKGGVQRAYSEHLWFDYDTGALRITTRADGQPWRGSTLSPAKGSTTRGNFVTLATRA